MDDNKLLRYVYGVGMWFILSNIEDILDWKGSNEDLIKYLYSKKCNRGITTISSRISKINSIIERDKLLEALVKIKDAEKVNKMHPGAKELAEDIIKRRLK